jgi:serine phosphatase RsbU (regulator of sigma subunit)
VFKIPGKSEIHIDLNIRTMVRVRLVKINGSDQTDRTTAINTLSRSLSSQCSFTLNGVSVTLFKDLYHYTSHLENLLTYDHNSEISYLTNNFRYLDYSDFNCR